MNRFFVDIDGRDIGTDIEITGGDVNHIKNVLRLKIGEEILVSDGRGRDYTCRISRIDPDKVVCNIEDISDNFAELPVKVTMFQGYPKSDKMDLIVQKMVELGVCRIIGVELAGSALGLGEDAGQAGSETVGGFPSVVFQNYSQTGAEKSYEKDREIPNYCGIRSETVRARDRSRDYRAGIICQSAEYGVGT